MQAGEVDVVGCVAHGFSCVGGCEVEDRVSVLKN